MARHVSASGCAVRTEGACVGEGVEGFVFTGGVVSECLEGREWR